MSQKITNEQVHQAYLLGKSVAENSISLSDAADRLSESHSMNRGSAYGYIYTVQNLFCGKEYRRTINAYATDYYLKKILHDYGSSALNTALEAVRKHLEYYEGVGKSSQPKIHAIVSEHLKVLGESTTLEAHYQEFEKQVELSLSEAHEDRKLRLKAAHKKPKTITVVTEVFRRNPDVVAETLFRAKGVCECCNKPAPFKRAKDGSPYLEVHHKLRLSKGGEDTVENTIALCPNCHRELHYGQ